MSPGEPGEGKICQNRPLWPFVAVYGRSWPFVATPGVRRLADADPDAWFSAFPRAGKAFSIPAPCKSR